MVVELPIEPKQTVPFDYTDTVGRPVRFLLEVHYDADRPRGDQFRIALHYDMPPQPDYIDDEPPRWLDHFGIARNRNAEFFRWDEFLEDRCAIYSLIVYAQCVNDQYLRIETRLFGFVQYDEE